MGEKEIEEEKERVKEIERPYENRIKGYLKGLVGL
jgi:hypothetical protein